MSRGGIMHKSLTTILLLLLLTSASHTQTVQTSWIKSYDPTSYFDAPFAIAVDSQQYVYVAGKQRPDNGDVPHIIKYLPNGTVSWSRLFKPSWLRRGVFTCVGVDASGNVFAGGHCETTALNYDDMLIVKYGPSGDTLWSKYYDGIGEDGYDYVEALTIDDEGNVYVTGRSDSLASYGTNLARFITQKYSSSGTLVWSRAYGIAGYGGVSGNNSGYDVMLSPSQDRVCAAGTRSYDGHSVDFYLLLMNPSTGGTVAWDTLDRGGSAQYLRDMDIDSDGYIYVTGQDSYGTFDQCFLTAKYAPTLGEALWRDSLRITGWGNVTDAAAIKADGQGGAYITGQLGGGTGIPYWNILTARYAPSGGEQWVRTYNGTGNGDDMGRDLVVDDSGYAYVTGTTWTTTQHDVVTLKYDP